MATTTRTRRTRTAAAADTAPKVAGRDLDESDVIADGERMADELAAREAAAAKPTRRTRKAAAPAATETAPETPAAAPARRSRKGRAEAAAAQPQPPAQPVEAAPAAPADTEGAKPATPRLDQKAIVLAFLTAHPGEEFSPQAVSKAITPEGRKPLGVRDCLARLAKQGTVEVTSEKPLRYRLVAAA
ncbi:hypothetical protein [Micromonospora sp. NPDC049891]|uniref:hypothetical protein n=1 Tax=Micromonospora sp. NPDC049891 TaxID=3155655 RepID=UPI0033E29C81